MKLTALLVSLLTPLLWAANADAPHPHRGVIPAIVGAPPSPELTRQERGQILSGEPVLKQVQDGSGGRAVAIFLVQTPPEAAWSVIMDYPHYAGWVEDLDVAEIYPGDDEFLFVRFKTTVMRVTVEWFIKHTVRVEEEGWVTWTLDYDRESDLDDSVGYWRVTPHHRNPNASIVEYSVDLRLRSWVPGFIKRILVDKGLEQATSWVKIQAEARHR
jgi:hypothetical protein